jgi:rhamnogalacturonyl hydrolase YesR
MMTLTAMMPVSAQTSEEPMSKVVERGLQRATSQSLVLANALKDRNDALPRTFDKGRLQTIRFDHWVSGFFPGVLWMLYENSKDERLRQYAEQFTARVEPAKKMTNTHDLGFMLYCSFGQGYRLTGNKHYLDVIDEGTQSLLTRWNDKLGVIKSWDGNKQWQYPVIIDNMMSLEMLCFMTRETGDMRYERIAERHANTTMKNHFRDDFSTFHVVSYDTITGQPHARNTHQGYADGSAWARGQAWGLYGYTMMYRETLNPRYLRQAQEIGKFLMHHPRLPKDKVPYWDYDAPGTEKENGKCLRDASAAAIMASALIELSQLDPTELAPQWLALAQQQLRTLSSPTYLAGEGEQGGFIIKHGVGHHPAGAEIDVPLTYADYYYVEALMRMKQLLAQPTGMDDRRLWIEQMTRIASPVLENLAAGTLKKNMPFESLSREPLRKEVSYLEAVGRTICGIAPWLELGPDDTDEGKLRAHYIDLVVRGLKNGVNPQSPDHLMFDRRHTQPLVDAAFLAEGILRAPTQIWGRLDQQTKDWLIGEWKTSRGIKPYESNWLLFASIIEAALLEFTGECDMQRLMYGVNRFRNEWYKGDAWYGDGRDFHLDYYNSLVIHPMFTETLQLMKKHNLEGADFLPTQTERHGRLAAELERMISPEGSYPVTGRSIVYRFGSFHALADAALLHILPANVSPAQVRCALTAVIRRQLSQPRTFDAAGWLRIGYTGSQIRMSEDYINTGSLYLCTAAFLPLGLPADDPFWSSPARPWTALKAWNGQDVGADHAIR